MTLQLPSVVKPTKEKALVYGPHQNKDCKGENPPILCSGAVCDVVASSALGKKDHIELNTHQHQLGLFEVSYTMTI